MDEGARLEIVYPERDRGFEFLSPCPALSTKGWDTVRLSAYAEDHACVPKLLLARCFDGALRRAGTGFARGRRRP